MGSSRESVEKPNKDATKLQRNKNGDENPAATDAEDVANEEEEYYEEGNGGATD